MSLAVVRSIDAPRHLRTASDLEEFEQNLVDQHLLAMVGAGLTDGHVSSERAAVVEFIRFLGRPVWTASSADADRFLSWLRRDRQLARQTVEGKAGAVARFFDFLIVRHQGDLHVLTGVVVSQPIDEFNRPTGSWAGSVRVPPSDGDVDALFAAWRAALPDARKYWRPDLGEHGKPHIRFGKGSRGRGPKTRLVPAINDVDALLGWWLTAVRHQFGDDWTDPDAPLLPSERRNSDGRATRAGTEALRSGLSVAVQRWLPDWQHRLTPHVLRHYCASSLYHRGVALKAVQELLGHDWLETTTIYVHVHDDHVERAWAAANIRVAERLTAP